jgi:hypothetical protein
MFSLKKAFAKNIASMHDSEIFGIKGKKDWWCLFKDYVILDVLENYKKKCYDPCFDFVSISYTIGLDDYIALVVDDFKFDLEVGDNLRIIEETAQLSDIVEYEIESLTTYSEMGEEQVEAIDNAGLSQNSVIIFLVGITIVSEISGNMELFTPKQLVINDSELVQEDINCLTGKFC